MPAKKPISDKQLAANRANAKKSTGPRRENRKKTVSLDSQSHDPTGLAAVLSEEFSDAQEAFCQDLIAELAPASITELHVAQSIAYGMQRLNYVRALEASMFARGQAAADPDPDRDPARQAALANARTFMEYENEFDLLYSCEERTTRAVQRNFALLRRLQAKPGRAA